jgi:uncharacterized membrane protein
MYSKVKIAGHPVHPMIIAYPVAFYTATLVTFIIYGATDDRFWLRMAIALNVAGVVMAVVAALPGFIDWAFGVPRNTEARRTGMLHMLANVGALGLFAICAARYLDNWNGAAEPARAGIVLAALGVSFTIFAGFQGWKLVQDHHVGVNMDYVERGTQTYETPDMRRAS